ncbi:stage III sporulation protein SpoIIIAB [Candidatus Desulforudis audaxviator]|uniref:Transcriptional regulator, Fis family n=1 Tax=Desulforudis audaxviator (strain MP104C) TaxID=477974 RepID=B1I3A8_DESAP|nr:stage III sporulation protein SpoIIIAB [Candidatus Desulforudis audaxviator]ACA59520.1 transcriptional regulator, Fis family [Candidatus Desulforudis audaxviator MP104C]AZK59503.1 Stage III sporulation protein AB [Candidatus Desulforudis audaxviator]
MFKLAGAVILIGSAGALGLLVARGYARRPHELRAMHSALNLLETEIVYAAAPLAEALEQVGSRAEKCVSGLFIRAQAELAAGAGTTAQEAWEWALAQYQPDSYLRPEDLAVLEGVGKVLGTSDRQDQARHLRVARERLQAQILKAEDEARRNVRLWRYLGFFAGCAVVLILV